VLQARPFNLHQIPRCVRRLDRVANEFVEAVDHSSRISRWLSADICLATDQTPSGPR
jgi:aminoglycoside phosphotransferase (APT) family kinase protein